MVLRDVARTGERRLRAVAICAVFILTSGCRFPGLEEQTFKCSGERLALSDYGENRRLIKNVKGTIVLQIYHFPITIWSSKSVGNARVYLRDDDNYNLEYYEKISDMGIHLQFMTFQNKIENSAMFDKISGDTILNSSINGQYKLSCERSNPVFESDLIG